MAEKYTKWTEQQLRAIKRRGSDVLVSASAGTGKTAVLSGRCVDIVSDQGVCPDVYRILVLTFTEAAAEQMRTRIAEQLREAFAQTKNPHLRRQLLLLQGAEISTIHSFCKRLISEHFYKLGLDPTFAVIDADEARLLKAKVLERTIDWAWENIQPPDVLEQLFCGRDLRTADGFAGKIIAMNDFLEAVVSRDDWYRRAVTLADAYDPFESPVGERQKELVTNRLRNILGRLLSAKGLCDESCEDEQWAAQCQRKFVQPVADCLALAESGRWNSLTEKIRNFEKPRVLKPRSLTAPLAELIGKTLKTATDDVTGLADLALLNPDYVDKVGRSAGLQTKVLIGLAEKFERLYTRAKSAINCMDFADLERYALKLLAEEDSPGQELSPSATALALRSRYKYIFVDEYQDINAVQQAILELLSGGSNVFGVGDVKQSIYAWRGAEPTIFLEQLLRASTEPADPLKGLRVDLNTNFRSVKDVLEFVNQVFERIMTGSFVGITYDEAATLKPAPRAKSETAEKSGDELVVEFHILDQQQKDTNIENEQENASDEPDTRAVISSRQRQAAVVARRIKEMVGADAGKAEFQIYDKNREQCRDVEYRDIVILMRSPAKRAGDYVEVLRLAGIPVSCDAVAGYFEATEITDMLCLLKVLDNPQRDIELAAVLRSPLFGLADTELARVKLHSSRERRVSLYQAVRQYCRGGTEDALKGKVEEVMGRIDCWRGLARRGSLADLIWLIYRWTGYLSFVQALPNGQARRANLLKLHDRAIQFEGFVSSGGIASLTRFVAFIEKLQQLGQDWTPAEPDSSAVNAVRIISVHKSKGLEFPVVFLAELNSRFNLQDVYDQCLTDATHTIGLQVIDRGSNSRLSSLAHQVIAEEKLSTALAEEMRILYVAMTRARERLILSSSVKAKRCHEVICEGLLLGEGPVADWQLRRCRSAVEWLLYALSDQTALHQAFQTGLADRRQGKNLFNVKVHRQAELQQLNDYVKGLKDSSLRQSRSSGRRRPVTAADRERLSQLKASLTWRYQFGDATLLPAKQSVTQITHRSDEYVKYDYSRALERRPRAVLPAGIDVVEDAQARLIGIATHLVMARLDLQCPITNKAVEEITARLVADGAITQAVADRVDAESIVTFFASEPGRLVLDSRNTVRREWPFTWALPASEWQDTKPLRDTRYETRDTIVVQGIIDLLVKTGSGLVVIDFKTDHVTADAIGERATLYRRQLELYGRAAAEILKEELHARWLYFLYPRQAVEV